MRFERWLEATHWLLAVGFSWLTWRLAGQVDPEQIRVLYIIGASFAACAVIYYRLAPASSERILKYEPEDKVLVASISMFALMTAYMYLAGQHHESLVFLYLLPILISTMLLDEKIIVAEAALAVLSATFLHGAMSVSGGFFQTGFIIRLSVFFGVSLMLVFLTGELRKRTERADSLVKDLSIRLDQLQVVSIIVRQIEVFSKLDTLLQRLTEIVASALGSEICGIYLPEDGQGTLRLRGECCGLNSSQLDVLRDEKSLNVFRDVHKSGSSRRLPDGPESEKDALLEALHSRNMLITPLRVRAGSIGVLFVANKREGDFNKTESEFMEMLGGYVATLIDSSMMFKTVLAERQTADRMTKLLVGRELKMKELKQKLMENKGL